MKLHYLLIAIVCLSNQSIKSNDEMIEYGKIAAISIGTAVSYGLVHHHIAARMHPESYKEKGPFIQALKSHGLMSAIGMSLIVTSWGATPPWLPILTAENLLRPLIIALTGVETTSLLAGIHSYRKKHSSDMQEFYRINQNIFAIEAAHRMADRVWIVALIGMNLGYANKIF